MSLFSDLAFTLRFTERLQKIRKVTRIIFLVFWVSVFLSQNPLQDFLKMAQYSGNVDLSHIGSIHPLGLRCLKTHFLHDSL